MSDQKQIALVGQPNVGKSTLFTRLTGVGVISSNYPGTTVEFKESTIIRKGENIHVHDLPGTYSLSTNSDDERVVIEMLLREHNDSVVLVADALNLESSLTLCFEVFELGLPTIVALNRLDVAEKRITIDADALSNILGVLVVPVSAKTGKGIEELLDCITSDSASISDFKVTYDDHIEEYVKELSGFLRGSSIPERGLSVKLLENVTEFDDFATEDIHDAVIEMQNEFRDLHPDTIDVHIAKDRFIEAGKIASEVTSKIVRERSLSEKFSDFTITPATGIPFLAFVLLSLLFVIIYAGSFLDSCVNWVYENVIGDSLVRFGADIGGELGEAIMSGVNGSIISILTLVIPYIMVFYIMLGILEDTGYLPRAVVLLDRFMHKIGLHGGGFIPITVGLGCNVPAVMATRSMTTRRERVIACTIIVMAVPCSAQIAIIFGTTGTFAGMQYSLLIVCVLIALAGISGVIMDRILPSQPADLAMELPELAMPSVKNVLFKMWNRTKDFFVIAVPILVVGSVIIEIMMTYGWLDPFVQPLSFITVNMLGLPAVLIIGFIVGILRKEMAYGMLVILAGSTPITEFMTPDQFVVFGMVMAVYMPCLATLTTMGKELGWKSTAAVSCCSIAVALAIGTLMHFVLAIL